METGVWEPTGKKESDYIVDIDFLKSVIRNMNTLKSDDISSVLTEEEKLKHQAIMLQPKEQWFTIAEKLEVNDLITLLRFFTLAEIAYANWHAEEKSPVISLAKLLRQRGNKIDKSLLKWIKANNPNKFLPYGPLM
ncbi:MAG: hypothetical protein ACRBCI_08855 [Cellvibrionaceae bacterium]